MLSYCYYQFSPSDDQGVLWLCSRRVLSPSRSLWCWHLIQRKKLATRAAVHVKGHIEIERNEKKNSIISNVAGISLQMQKSHLGFDLTAVGFVSTKVHVLVSISTIIIDVSSSCCSWLEVKCFNSIKVHSFLVQVPLNQTRVERLTIDHQENEFGSYLWLPTTKACRQIASNVMSPFLSRFWNWASRSLSRPVSDPRGQGHLTGHLLPYCSVQLWLLQSFSFRAKPSEKKTTNSTCRKTVCATHVLAELDGPCQRAVSIASLSYSTRFSVFLLTVSGDGYEKSGNAKGSWKVGGFPTHAKWRRFFQQQQLL